MNGKACGFKCPQCGYCCSDITGVDMEHILELRCAGCGFEYAVEVG